MPDNVKQFLKQREQDVQRHCKEIEQQINKSAVALDLDGKLPYTVNNVQFILPTGKAYFLMPFSCLFRACELNVYFDNPANILYGNKADNMHIVARALFQFGGLDVEPVTIGIPMNKVSDNAKNILTAVISRG